MSFLTPWFFLGTLAASVPILLHLIKRERARKIEFPTLMYLRMVQKRTIRFQKLRHLLLLLLRVLVLLLLALAFTRPFRETLQVATASGRPSVAHIVLVDNSLSMGYGDRWERAKRAAADIVRRADPTDKLALLEFSDRVMARTQLGSEAGTALRQIESEMELSDRPTRYSQALKFAEKFALDAGTRKRVVYLISDYQKNGWALDDQVFRLDSSIELKPVDVGSNDFSNLTIGDVHVMEAAGLKAEGLKIKAAIVNFGNQDRKNVRVTFILDGRNVTEKRVDVSTSASQGVEFEIPGLTAGLHPIVLEVEDPNLKRDNRFSMTVEARSKTPVISVESPSAGRSGRPPSFFIAHALNISTLSPYRLTAIMPQKAEALGGAYGATLMIWNNAPGGSGALQKKLQEFVRSGNGLVVVLGAATSPSDFNRSFGAWIPVKMQESSPQGKRPAEDYVLLTDIRMDHPIFRPFNTPHSGNFTGAKFFRHAALTAKPGSEVVARFDNGDPAMVLAEDGKGHVLVLAFAADDEWNDLPLKSVYAPFWQQALRFLDNTQEGRRWVEVGETVAPRKALLDAALRNGQMNVDLNQAIVVLNPARQRETMPGGPDALTVDKAGFYEVRTTSLNTIIAVNPVPRESDLTHASVDELVAGWTTQPGAAAQATDEERLSREEQEKRQRFWRFILLGVLVFLIAEVLLANQSILKAE